MSGYTQARVRTYHWRHDHCRCVGIIRGSSGSAAIGMSGRKRGTATGRVDSSAGTATTAAGHVLHSTTATAATATAEMSVAARVTQGLRMAAAMCSVSRHGYTIHQAKGFGGLG